MYDWLKAILLLHDPKYKPLKNMEEWRWVDGKAGWLGKHGQPGHHSSGHKVYKWGLLYSENSAVF